MQINQGAGVPAGRSVSSGVTGMTADWGGPVVTGAAPVVVATTGDVNIYTGQPPANGFTLLIGSCMLIQTAGGAGNHQLGIERSVDGGSTWAAVNGGVPPVVPLDSSATLATPAMLVPVFCRFQNATFGPRERVRYRLTAATSAGAGTAEASLQAIAI